MFRRSLTPVGRGLSLLAGLIVLISASCFAQAQADPPAESPPQAPTVQVEVNRVLIPVVVRDKRGNAIGDLKESDFTVFDDGKPRPLSGFSVERHLVSAETPNSAAAAAPTPAARAVSALPDRIIVLLFDDLDLGEEDLAHSRQAALAALPGMLNGSTMAAVVNLSGSVNSGITRDPSTLEAAIARIEPNPAYHSTGAGCPSLSYYQADLIVEQHDDTALGDATHQVLMCDPGLAVTNDYQAAQRIASSAAHQAWAIGRQRIQTTYANLGEWVRRMAKLPGQRILLLISPGFLPLGDEGLLDESRAIDLAAGSGVLISALDTRGVYTTELTADQASPGLSTVNHTGGGMVLHGDYARTVAMMGGTAMGALAEGTGGSLFENSNDLTAGLHSLTAAPETIYLLELPLNGVKANGAFHRLQVKVDRSGIDVAARRGYFVPKPEKKD